MGGASAVAPVSGQIASWQPLRKAPPALPPSDQKMGHRHGRDFIMRASKVWGAEGLFGTSNALPLYIFPPSPRNPGCER